MKKSIMYGLFAFLIAAMIAGAFYWFEYRPIGIRKECAKNNLEIHKSIKEIGAQAETGFGDDMRYAYEICLHAKGL